MAVGAASNISVQIGFKHWGPMFKASDGGRHVELRAFGRLEVLEYVDLKIYRFEVHVSQVSDTRAILAIVNTPCKGIA